MALYQGDQNALALQTLMAQQQYQNTYANYLGPMTTGSVSASTNYTVIGLGSSYKAPAVTVQPVAVVADPDCVAWLKGRVDEICWHA